MRHDVDRRAEPDKKLPVTTVVGIAAAAGLVPLNSTMIAVALPTIADDFDISTGSASVLVTVYLVAMLVGQPLAGRLSDALGNRRTVTLALLGLSASSLVAAFAPTFTLLVATRLAQAAFAAALSPSVQSLLRTITPPEEQGRTFGLLGSVMGVGAALGPVIGGVLVQGFGWEAIFLVNVPITAGALVAARRAGRFTTEAPAEPATNDSSPHDDNEAVDVSVSDERVLNRVFVACFSAQALSTVAQYALLLITPMLLDARGWPSGSIGLVLSALTIGMIVMGPPGGRAGDERGARLPTMAGLLVAAAAVAMLAAAGQSVTSLLLVTGLAVFGLGLGAATPNFTSAALASVPMNRTGGAAGVLSMSRYVGSIATSLVISAFVTDGAEGSRAVLVMSFAAMVAAVAMSSQLPSAPQGRATRRR